jgi:hypothetical protein
MSENRKGQPEGRRIPKGVCYDAQEFSPSLSLAQSIFRRRFIVEHAPITRVRIRKPSRIRVWRDHE